MAQSAGPRKTPLPIVPFWKKPSSEPPLRREQWRTQVKLAILAKEGTNLDVLLNPKPTRVNLLSEPRQEQPIYDHTETTEGERKLRNAQLKVSWNLKCQKITNAGILCWLPLGHLMVHIYDGPIQLVVDPPFI